MKTNLLLMGILLLLALLLRSYDYAYPAFPWMDEKEHVQAAMNYWQNGQFEPEMWEHPPLRHLLLKGFLEAFGDNPLGWRLRNILTGALTAVLVFLFTSEISGSRRAAFLAGMLIATDPLHLVLSRFTFDEIYGSCFFLAALVLFLRHRQRPAWLVLSAACIGCALAIKWNYAPGWLLLLALALHQNDTFRRPADALFVVSTYLLVPLGIYLLAYAPWFTRGYSLAELLELAGNSYRSLQQWAPESYNQQLFFLKHLQASDWFLHPVIVGQGTYAGVGAGRGEFILYGNNLPVWILTIPAMFSLAYLSVKERNLRLAWPVLFFCGIYGLYLGVKRPIFIYTAATLLPFAFAAIACGITRLAERYSVRLYYAAVIGSIAWSLYLYPLATAKKVPVAAYRFILEYADIRLVE